MRIINPDTLAPPRGYNNGILTEGGHLLFIAGQVGWDREQNIATGIVSQFDRALSNILEVLRTAGGEASHICRFTIFIKDKKDYLSQTKEIGQVYRNHMGKHYPAMSLLIVKDLLEQDALVEIEATAVIP